jgi:hypothetical protein
MNGHTEKPDGYWVQTGRGLDGISGTAGFWFHDRAFLQGQPCGEPAVLELRRRGSGRVAATFVLYERDGTGVSPCRAPFGGISLDPQVPFDALNGLIKAADVEAQQRGLREVRVVCYPFCYAPAASALLAAGFAANGYAVAVTDLNFHIAVTGEPLEGRLHPSERRRLRKCLRAGLHFAEELVPDLPHLYGFVADCRRRRGFPVTLDYAAFEALLLRFPDHYRVFTVRDAGRLAALAVGVRVSPEILYYFYPADDPAYQTYSPTVLLLAGMYEYARSHGYRLLDLGIATDSGQPNPGLIRFKRNMGAEPSLKLTFRKAFFTDG